MHRPARRSAHAALITLAAALAVLGAGTATQAFAAAPAASSAPALERPQVNRVVNGVIDDHPGGGEPSAKVLVATGARTRGQMRTYGSISRTLPVVVQKQSTSYYCAPASGRAAISALVSPAALPSQQTLATRMGTTASGTALSRIGPALNTVQSRNAYTYVSGLDLAGYQSRIRGGIDTYGAPQVAPVQMSRLPWYAGTGISGGHAVTSYGYFITTKAWTMHVYDPWDGVRHLSVSSASMFTASLNRDLIW